jgi:hypothetical protein
MGYEHRVIEKEYLPHQFPQGKYYEVHEVFDFGDYLSARNNPSIASADSLEELRILLRRMLESLDKEILTKEQVMLD